MSGHRPPDKIEHLPPGICEDALITMRKEAARAETEWLALKKQSRTSEHAAFFREQVKFWQTRMKAIRLAYDVEFKLIGRLPSIPEEFRPHYQTIQYQTVVAA